jgi:hypothetical protein
MLYPSLSLSPLHTTHTFNAHKKKRRAKRERKTGGIFSNKQRKMEIVL